MAILSSLSIAWLLSVATLNHLYGLLHPGHPFGLKQHWAQYSPYHAVGKYHSPPPQCKVTQVNILHRHGARFPTTSTSKAIKHAVVKLKSARKYKGHKMKFLKHFKYKLGKEELVPFGAAQSFESGFLHFKRYAKIVHRDDLPFVRASGKDRVVMSATNWTEDLCSGFAHASHWQYNPRLSVIIPESQNDTLDNAMCPKAKPPDDKVAEWISIYAPRITARLNKRAPGANLTDTDTYNIMSLCPFESVANEARSRFCRLFTRREFRAYEYAGDLAKFYGTGYGNPLGRVQGVGYVNELLARLTGQPVHDHTQTNRTSDSSPEMFPLNRTIYADFTHENLIAAVFSAVGLFPQDPVLDPARPRADRVWVASKLVPFSARMVTERIECGPEGEKYVRIFVNDALQPLKFCGPTWDGMCRLEQFVESQWYARSDGAGDFEKCH